MTAKRDIIKQLRAELKEAKDVAAKLRLIIGQKDLTLERTNEAHREQLLVVKRWVIAIQEEFEKEFSWNRLADFKDERMAKLERTLTSVEKTICRWQQSPAPRAKK